MSASRIQLIRKAFHDFNLEFKGYPQQAFELLRARPGKESESSQANWDRLGNINDLEESFLKVINLVEAKSNFDFGSYQICEKILKALEVTKNNFRGRSRECPQLEELNKKTLHLFFPMEHVLREIRNYLRERFPDLTNKDPITEEYFPINLSKELPPPKLVRKPSLFKSTSINSEKQPLVVTAQSLQEDEEQKQVLKTGCCSSCAIL